MTNNCAKCKTKIKENKTWCKDCFETLQKKWGKEIIEYQKLNIQKNLLLKSEKN